MPETSREQAIRILGKLRSGSNILERVSIFSAGRAKLLAAFQEEVEELQITNGASVRWIKGRYGHGKTHMFGRLMEMGHSQNWVTAFVQIRLPGQGRSLAKFNEVYAGIVQNFLCQGMTDEQGGQVNPGKQSGWSWILDKWYSGLEKQAGRTTGGVSMFRLEDTINQTITALKERHAITGSFCSALREYATGRTENDQEWTEIIQAWFIGEDVHARGGETRKRLREKGILESLKKNNAKEMLRCLSAFVRYRGFGGIMIMLDEVENVLHAPERSRRESYTVLRELIDNVDDRHGMTNVCFYIAGTPDLFEGEKGLLEYEALAARALPPGGLGSNPRAPLIDLSLFPLGRSDFVEIAQGITRLYEIKNGTSVPPGLEQKILSHLDDLRASNPDPQVRIWVKIVVDLCDEEFI
jgi:hypothetical protein